MTPPRAQRVALSTGVGLHLLEWGPASAPPLLLVHGFLDSAWSWQPAVQAGLAERFRVLAPELRGHGLSDRVGPGGYYHFYDYVADVAALVEALELEPMALVGHSMGGSVASYYAGAFPARVARLALLEGLGPLEDPTPLPERVAQWAVAWPAARRKAARGYASLEQAAARLRQSDELLTPELALWLAERTTTPDAEGRLHFQHDPVHLTRGPYPYTEAAAAEFWRRITCPVLAVEGERSPYAALRPVVERRLSHFSKVRSVTLQGAAHMLQRHQPAALAALLTDFFTEREPPEPAKSAAEP